MGHHNLRYDGDPNALKGAWSPPTSRANFCEEDYDLTFYIAEFINSVTNVAYVYLALQYMYDSGRRTLFSPRWDFMSITLLVLGIGSFVFHASLRQTLEFVDELSMMGLTWSLLQSVLTRRQPAFKARLISTLLAAACISFSIFYVRSAKIIYQVIAFTSSLFVVLLRSEYLFYKVQPPFPKEKTRDWHVRTWKATGFCVFAYILWNIDLEFCHVLRDLRHQIGLPWSWSLELHGWWHVLTAVGAAQFMQVAREMREEEHREKKKQ